MMTPWDIEILDEAMSTTYKSTILRLLEEAKTEECKNALTRILEDPEIIWED